MAKTDNILIISEGIDVRFGYKHTVYSTEYPFMSFNNKSTFERQRKCSNGDVGVNILLFDDYQTISFNSTI